MKKPNNCKWFIDQAIKRTTYIGGSFRRGVAIEGHDVVYNSEMSQSDKAIVITHVTEKLRNPRNYTVLITIVKDSLVGEVIPVVCKLKNVTVTQLDVLIKELIVKHATDCIVDGDWGYGFIAWPLGNKTVTSLEIERFIDYISEAGVWDQNLKRLNINEWLCAQVSKMSA